MIDWSWSLLGKSEQAALRRLCSFPSGFSLEAAIAVAGSDRDDLESVEDDIEILLNQLLLLVYENQQSSHLRYRMLETVREFGAIEQDRAAEVTLVATQMAAWARSWCTERIDNSYGPRQLKTVHEVTIEQDNLIFILRRAIVERDTKTVFPLFALLGNYWSIRSMHQDVVSFADAVMESIRDVPVEDEDVQAALLAVTIISATTAMVNLRLSAKSRTMVRRLLARNIPLDEHLRTMSELWLCLGSPEKLAVRVAQAKASQHKMKHSTAFLVESFLMENSGRIAEAISAAQTAFRLGKELDDGWTMGTVSVSLAQLFTQRANHAQALSWGERAVEYLSELDAVSDLRQLQALIAANHISLGQLEAAEHIFAAELANLDDDQFFDSPGIGIAVQAEIYLHTAQVAARLAAYRTLLDSKIYQALPTGPYGPVLVAAAICAHLLNDLEHGKSVSVRQQTLDYWCKHLRLRTIAWRRMSGQSFTDRPVLGTSAMTIGSWAALTAASGSPRSSVGLELLTMSGGRQDVPSLLWERHLAAARSRLGDAAVETQLRLAPGFSSDASLQRVFELLSDPSLRD
ncbi:hypothetical protein [Renibacterium salmoninarum]|uniref:hypothetical protein n=1 Tax=Renibacterium salmoninarum TaxID=1646 RepID=UPI0013143E95|nr:hypothetical protein [Renibacterium salmoninarum]